MPKKNYPGWKISQDIKRHNNKKNKKMFAEIWEEEKIKYADIYREEIEKNKGLVNIGKRKKESIKPPEL